MLFEIGTKGRSDIGTQVEKLVLDTAQPIRDFARRQRGDGDTDRRVGLVDLADRGDARSGLADAAAVDQPGGAAVAGARVDFVELDQRYFPAPAASRISTTSKMAMPWKITRFCM